MRLAVRIQNARIRWQIRVRSVFLASDPPVTMLALFQVLELRRGTEESSIVLPHLTLLYDRLGVYAAWRSRAFPVDARSQNIP